MYTRPSPDMFNAGVAAGAHPRFVEVLFVGRVRVYMFALDFKKSTQFYHPQE